MPAPAIKSLATKAGKSEAEAEKLWSKAKEQAKGSKLKDGSTVPNRESAFKDKDWAYVTGIFKKMAGIKESDARYRVFINGDEVQIIHEGQQVALGADGGVEQVREKIQDLLDSNVESVFDLGGFVGTLAEIERQVLDDWITFCAGENPWTLLTNDGGP